MSLAYKAFCEKYDLFCQYIEKIAEEKGLLDIQITDEMTLNQGLELLKGYNRDEALAFIGMHLCKYKGWERMILNMKLEEYGLRDYLNNENIDKLVKFAEFFIICVNAQ